MPDNLEKIRRKLRFRSLRRGTKESDLVIGGFAAVNLEVLDAPQLESLEALLDENDQDVLSWIIGVKPPPNAFNTDVLDMLKQFKKNS